MLTQTDHSTAPLLQLSRGDTSSQVCVAKHFNITLAVPNAVDAELGERVDLTIDTGCAACALLEGVASAVGMQELNRTPQG